MYPSRISDLKPNCNESLSELLTKAERSAFYQTQLPTSAPPKSTSLISDPTFSTPSLDEAHPNCDSPSYTLSYDGSTYF